MRTRTGLRRGEAGAGFTLIEVLLATVLLLLLVGALIINFSSLEQGARLDEGASLFEAMLRYARAHALSSGRQVQVLFEEPLDPDVALALDTVRVTWEPDPLGKPGVFEDLPQAKDYLGRLNDLVQVSSLRLIGPGNSDLVGASGQANQEQENPGESLGFFPPIRFFPDGASDSAEIVLVSRDEQDKRRVGFRLSGITGLIKRSDVETGGQAATNKEETVAMESKPQGGPATVREAPKPARETGAEAPRSAPASP